MSSYKSIFLHFIWLWNKQFYSVLYIKNKSLHELEFLLCVLL